MAHTHYFNCNLCVLQDYVAEVLKGMQHISIVCRDNSHTVVSCPNSHIMAKVIDTFKQRSGVSFATYRKPKDFGDRGN